MPVVMLSGYQFSWGRGHRPRLQLRHFVFGRTLQKLAWSAAPQVKAITNGRCANVPSPLWLDDKLGGLRPRMPGGATISNFCRRVFELRNYCWWLRGLRESIIRPDPTR